MFLIHYQLINIYYFPMLLINDLYLKIKEQKYTVSSNNYKFLPMSDFVNILQFEIKEKHV